MEGDRDSRRLTTRSEVGIVGAGIAGTTLAIALKQSGLPVRLYDQPQSQPRPEDDPAPVLLTANGSRVLNAIGLKEDLAEIGLLPHFSTLRHARTGFLLSQRPLGAFSEARYGASDVLINRNHLVQRLRQKASAAGIPLDVRSPVTEVDASSATLTFQDGGEAQHQCLAVAGGLPSAPPESATLSNLLNERKWAASSDLISIRAVGRRREQNRDHERFINTWVADGLIAVEEPLPDRSPEDRQAQRVSLTLLSPLDESLFGATPEAQLSTLLERAHPYLRQLVQDPVVEPLQDVTTDIAEYWFAEKLVLLGGLCHAHPAFPALNDSAALEDAWILSRMMERWEESPHEGFADYERYRKPRAARLRRYAVAERAALAERSGPAAWQRNLKWSLTSRFLPEIAMQKTDWLYGYDCIKGFA